MKTQLVESHRERVRRIEARRAEGGRPERLHRDRALAAPGGRGRRHPDAWTRPSSRRQIDAVEAWRSRARPGRGRTRALDELRRGRRATRRMNIMPATLGRRARRRDHRRVGRARCATCSASTARPTGVADAAAADGRRGARPSCASSVERVSESLGRRDQDPGRQARPRRPLERRRADRRARARRRHGRGLRGHPADAGADRRARRSQEGVHVVGLSILSGSHARADPDRARASCARPAPTCRSWSAASSRQADEEALLDAGRGARLHAEGLRGQPHHGRHRGSGGRAPRRRGRGLSG